jgi:L-threonylcarbamoyladenylate synthase
MVRTKIIRVNPDNPEEEKIVVAANIIRKGGLVAFPTETVYGLGANGLDGEAVRKIFVAKKRPMDNPLILHVSGVDMIEEIAEVNETARKLINEFFPGPLTLVMRKKDVVPPEVTAGLDTVAVRMPSHPVAIKLIEMSELPIAAPSANLAGKPSPTKAEHVIEDLYERVDVIIDGGATDIGVESTVVDTTVYPVEVLRPGGLEVERIQEVVDIRIFSKSVDTPKSPGMKYRHYAPDARLFVLTGKREEIVEKITQLAEDFSKKGFRVGIAVTDPTPYKKMDAVVKEMGTSAEEVARNLFDVLRELDRHADIIIAEGIEERGIGLAVMNRLKKASDSRIFRV